VGCPQGGLILSSKSKQDAQGQCDVSRKVLSQFHCTKLLLLSKVDKGDAEYDESKRVNE
jgi:hypothetical protein